MCGKRGMVKGGQKGEGYEWETWGWLWLGKRVGKKGRVKGVKMWGRLRVKKGRGLRMGKRGRLWVGRRGWLRVGEKEVVMGGEMGEY